MGKIIGVISIKGGVGKTSVVSNLAAALTSFNKKVLVIDANFSAPNLALHLGLTKPEATIHDVLSNKIDPGDAIYEYDKNLHLIPGAFVYEKINPLKLREKINKLTEFYDVILIDSSPNLNNEMLATIITSDELLVVTSPDYPTLSCTINAVKIAKERKSKIAGLVINRVLGKDFELTIEDIEKATKVPVLGYLPEDHVVHESIANTTPATLYNPNKDISIEYKKLAAALLNEDFEDTRFLSKLKRLLRREPRKDEINRDLLREGKLY